MSAPNQLVSDLKGGATESNSVACWIWLLARLHSIIPCPVSIHSREQSSGHPVGGGRDERWRKFVGSISRLESFSSKRLTKKLVAKALRMPTALRWGAHDDASGTAQVDQERRQMGEQSWRHRPRRERVRCFLLPLMVHRYLLWENCRRFCVSSKVVSR